MNKILLATLVLIGSQQFILGAEVNKKPEPKLGVCLFCYTNNDCTHDIYDTYKKGKKNCPDCVTQVYSVCSQGHTMCGDCIYKCITEGLNNKGGRINCIFFNIDPFKNFGKNFFQPCHEQISNEIVEYILKNSAISKERIEMLEKYNRLKKELEFKRVLLHPENKECKYENCKGFFNVTENFFCKQDESHIHCERCFEKKHEGRCKDPLLRYTFEIEENRKIQKQIKKKELENGMTEGYKPCPNCHKIIPKAGGCNKITCGCDGDNKNWEDNGCGYQWCWRCGRAYIPYEHYRKGSCKMYPELYHKNDVDYGDDGDYFGIKNGKFEKQFEKLAREGVIDVEVDVKVNGQYDNIKKIDWDAINKGKKEWGKKNPNEKYYKEEEWKEENPNEKYYKEEDNTKNKGIYNNSKNCCTECCCDKCCDNCIDFC